MYMKRIHNQEAKKRFELGAPYERLLVDLLRSTNNGNLSPDWNQTDMARYCIAEFWKGTGRELPADAAEMLKPFWTDLDA